jgi:hypothetical protein
MDELFELRDSIFDEFGEGLVRSVADCVDFDVDIYPETLDDEGVLELFAEMINFIATELAVIDECKARKVLLSVGVSERDINHLLDL